MPIDEIFPRPLVKEVIFQVRYPNLFFIDNKIGEFQLSILKSFPDSALLLRKDFVFAQQVPGRLQTGKEGRLPEPDITHTIWQFKSPDGASLLVSRDNFSISSEQHKTYSHGDTNRFRDVIKLVCDAFFKLITIPFATRVGLRYMNHCPVGERTNEQFRELYSSALPLDRFPLENMSEFDFSTVVKKENGNLRYREQFPIAEDKNKLLLDLDAWAEKVEPDNILSVADNLHSIISTEFESFAKQPLLDYMRSPEATS